MKVEHKSPNLSLVNISQQDHEMFSHHVRDYGLWRAISRLGSWTEIDGDALLLISTLIQKLEEPFLLNGTHFTLIQSDDGYEYFRGPQVNVMIPVKKTEDRWEYSALGPPVWHSNVWRTSL